MKDVGRRPKDLFLPLLFLLGLTAYSNAIFHPFVHDDIIFIQANPQIANLDLLPIFFPTESLQQHTPLINAYYRPLLEILYRWQYQLFHLNAWGYHFFNILFHIVNSVLVLKVFQRILPQHQPLAKVTALFFLLHPIQTEAVACIAGVSNLVLTCFVLMSFWLYLLMPDTAGKYKALGLYGASLFFFLAALMAKEQAIILPALILFYEVWALGKKKERRLFGARAWQAAGYGAIVLGYFAWRKIVLGKALGPLLDYPGELGLRILSVPSTVLTYLRLLIVPYDLHYYRGADILAPAGWPIAVLAVTTALIVLGLRRLDEEHRRLIGFGLAWFLIALSPVLNIVPLINEYSLILTSEHFLYLPMAGIMLSGAALGQWLLSKWPWAEKGRIAQGCIILISLIFLFLTLKQNTYWRNEIVLFKRTLQFERLGRVHILLANAYYREGMFIESLEENKKALKIFEGYISRIQDKKVLPFYLGFIKGAYFAMAHDLYALGDLPLAIEHFQRALALDPKDGVLHNNLAVIFLQANRLEEARQHFEQAALLQPWDIGTKRNLALIYFDTGDLSQSEILATELLQKSGTALFAKDLLERIHNRQAGK